MTGAALAGGAVAGVGLVLSLISTDEELAEAEASGATIFPIEVPPNVRTYTVISGDTLTKIASRLNLSMTAILDMPGNEQLRSNPDLLAVGQQIVLPPVSERPSNRMPTKVPRVEGRERAPSEVGITFANAPGFVQMAIRESGWPEEEWENAAKIAKCESSFIPSAHNPRGEDSRGLWQINLRAWGADPFISQLDLWDPFDNAKAAHYVWVRQGYRAWYHCGRRAGLVTTRTT